MLRAGIAPRQIVVGTGCASLTDTLALTRHALENGVARCLVLPPFFFKNLSDDAVFALYAGLIDRVADSRLRLYVYHIPQFSGVAYGPSTLRRLADAYPGVVAGVKDSAADWTNTARLLDRVPHLDMLVGPRAASAETDARRRRRYDLRHRERISRYRPRAARA